MIGGIGVIHDRPCLVLSHIPTQSGGAWNEYTVMKVDRLTEIAAENNLPVVSLVQSVGTHLHSSSREGLMLASGWCLLAIPVQGLP
jgi:acetyl-CoA carboxylase carboxyltransferase component